MKPYMVDSIIDADGKTVYSGKPEKMGRATSKRASRILVDYMRSTAQECCSLHGLEYEKEVFDEYGVAGKTGTAEIKASKEDTTGTELGWFSVFTTDENMDRPIMIISMVEDVKGRGGSGYVVKKDSQVLEKWLSDN